MTGFYNVTKKIKDALNAEPFVNTVSYGSLDDVDLIQANHLSVIAHNRKQLQCSI